MSVELTETDRNLLRYADRGWTPTRIADHLNLAPGEVAQRIKRILDDHDWLSQLERQKLNIMGLEEVKNRLQDRARAAHADVKEVEAFVRATEAMHKLITEGTNITDEQIARISTKQAEAMLKLFTLAWDAAVSELRSRYPEVDIAAITDVFHEGLREGAKQLDA